MIVVGLQISHPSYSVVYETWESFPCLVVGKTGGRAACRVHPSLVVVVVALAFEMPTAVVEDTAAWALYLVGVQTLVDPPLVVLLGFVEVVVACAHLGPPVGIATAVAVVTAAVLACSEMRGTAVVPPPYCEPCTGFNIFWNGC